MKFEQASLQVVKFLQENSGVTDAAELQTVVTHLLHNISTKPPLLVPAAGKKLMKTLLPSAALKNHRLKASVAEDVAPYQPKLNLAFVDIPSPPLEKEEVCCVIFTQWFFRCNEINLGNLYKMVLKTSLRPVIARGHSDEAISSF